MAIPDSGATHRSVQDLGQLLHTLVPVLPPEGISRAQLFPRNHTGSAWGKFTEPLYEELDSDHRFPHIDLVPHPDDRSFRLDARACIGTGIILFR